MRTSASNKYSDSELLDLIKLDQENLTYLYNQNKESCIRFMNKIEFNDENKDLYQDAIIIFYEKITRQNEFMLTCSIQTYLNSICKKLIFKRYRKSVKSDLFIENIDYIEIEDDFDEYYEEQDDKILAMEEALGKLKDIGKKCHEILMRFFYYHQSMELIAKDLNYTNADNAKQQKARCQKKLKDLTFDILKA